MKTIALERALADFLAEALGGTAILCTGLHVGISFDAPRALDDFLVMEAVREFVRTHRLEYDEDPAVANAFTLGDGQLACWNLSFVNNSEQPVDTSKGGYPLVLLTIEQVSIQPFMVEGAETKRVSQPVAA